MNVVTLQMDDLQMDDKDLFINKSRLLFSLDFYEHQDNKLFLFQIKNKIK